MFFSKVQLTLLAFSVRCSLFTSQLSKIYSKTGWNWVFCYLLMFVYVFILILFSFPFVINNQAFLMFVLLKISLHIPNNVRYVCKVHTHRCWFVLTVWNSKGSFLVSFIQFASYIPCLRSKEVCFKSKFFPSRSLQHLSAIFKFSLWFW